MLRKAGERLPGSPPLARPPRGITFLRRRPLGWRWRAPRAQRRVRRPGRLQAADYHDARYEDSHKHQQHKTERAVSIVRVLDRGGRVKLAEELPQISRVRLPRRLRSSAVSVAVIRHFANST